MKKLLIALMLATALIGFSAQVFAQDMNADDEESTTEYQMDMDEETLPLEDSDTDSDYSENNDSDDSYDDTYEEDDSE